ncbi:MAG: hypothetical protein JXA28_15495 [Bacteroidetes bacterium]|nr:hypothetical protein [Bacteroidota bacterium]
MKSGRIFWGMLFLSIGILGALYTIFDISLCWNSLWKLWPLLLVFLGLSIFLKDSKSKWIVVAGIGLLAGVILFSSVQKGCSSVDRIIEDHGDAGDIDVIDQTLRIEYDSSTTRAAFTFEGGAGRFEITDTTADFVRADIHSSFSPYTLERNDFGEMPHFLLGMEDGSVTWNGEKIKNHVMMHLHPEPAWDIDIDAGAARINLDLRPFIVRNLSLETGATSMEVRLGSRADTTCVRVETGASTLTLHVPENVGCEVKLESALSKRSLKGFEKSSSGVYRSPNFSDAEKHIFISIESGLSTLRIDRYDSGEW